MSHKRTETLQNYHKIVQLLRKRNKTQEVCRKQFGPQHHPSTARTSTTRPVGMPSLLVPGLLLTRLQLHCRVVDTASPARVAPAAAVARTRHKSLLLVSGR